MSGLNTYVHCKIKRKGYIAQNLNSVVNDPSFTAKGVRGGEKLIAILDFV